MREKSHEQDSSPSITKIKNHFTIKTRRKFHLQNAKKNKEKKLDVLTFLPKTLCWWITCLKEYLLPGGIWSLKDSPSGTLEGIIQPISWPNAGQPNQPVTWITKREGKQEKRYCNEGILTHESWPQYISRPRPKAGSNYRTC